MKRLLLLAFISLAGFRSVHAQFQITTRVDNFVANGTSVQFDILMWDGGANYISGTTLWDDANIRYDLLFSGTGVPALALGSVTILNNTYIESSFFQPVIGGPAAVPPVYRFGLTVSRGTKPDLPTVPTPMLRVTVPYAGGVSAGTSTLFQRTNTSGNGSFWSSQVVGAGQGFDPQNNSTPLGVELLSFSASATPERTAKLEWQTATEKNSSHFIVERSADGTRFTDQVCRMQAAGTSNNLLTYHNFDYKPLTGDNYYRLKMVDKDGSVKYSETRRVVFEASIAEVAAIPNPFQNATNIRINADQAQVVNYQVMDYTGRTIRTGVWEIQKGVQQFQMPLEDAAAGNYILTVQGSTILAEIKLTKTN